MEFYSMIFKLSKETFTSFSFKFLMIGLNLSFIILWTFCWYERSDELNSWSVLESSSSWFLEFWQTEVD